MKTARMITLALVLAVGLQGCYGSFTLMKKIYNWNMSLENKYVKEGVFLCLTWYAGGVCAFADIVVLNTMEYWQGKNPLANRVIEKDGVKVAMRYDADRGVLVMDRFKDGKPDGSVAIYRNADGSMSATTLDGTRMTAKTVDGKVTVIGQDGKVLGTYRAEEADRYLN